MQSLKIVTILRKEVNLSVPQVYSEYFSATDYRTDFPGVTWKKLMRIKQSLKIVEIFRKEVVEKNAEFENSEHLNGRKQISSVLLV